MDLRLRRKRRAGKEARLDRTTEFSHRIVNRDPSENRLQPRDFTGHLSRMAGEALEVIKIQLGFIVDRGRCFVGLVKEKQMSSQSRASETHATTTHRQRLRSSCEVKRLMSSSQRLASAGFLHRPRKALYNSDTSTADFAWLTVTGLAQR